MKSQSQSRELSQVVRPSSLRAIRTDVPGGVVIRLEGLLDALSVGDTAPLFDALPRLPATEVRLDLSSLRMIDGRGVGAIVSLAKRLRSQGSQLRVVGARDQPLALLRLMRLEVLLG